MAIATTITAQTASTAKNTRHEMPAEMSAPQMSGAAKAPSE